MVPCPHQCGRFWPKPTLAPHGSWNAHLRFRHRRAASPRPSSGSTRARSATWRCTGGRAGGFAGTVPLPPTRRPPTTRWRRAASVLIVVGAVTLVGWTLLGGLDALKRCGEVGPAGWGDGLPAGAAGCVRRRRRADRPAASLYRTFRLEQRFGFNRMSFRLWLGDMIKGTIVGVVIGLPLAALVLGLMRESGSCGGCGPGRHGSPSSWCCWCSTRP